MDVEIIQKLTFNKSQVSVTICRMYCNIKLLNMVEPTTNYYLELIYLCIQPWSPYSALRAFLHFGALLR